jgi:hypothetical protein
MWWNVTGVLEEIFSSIFGIMINKYRRFLLFLERGSINFVGNVGSLWIRYSAFLRVNSIAFFRVTSIAFLRVNHYPGDWERSHIREKAPTSFVLSLSLSIYISVVPIWWISVRFDIGGVLWNSLCRKFKIRYNRTLWMKTWVGFNVVSDIEIGDKSIVALHQVRLFCEQ